jgi:hypothetical protein
LIAAFFIGLIIHVDTVGVDMNWNIKPKREPEIPKYSGGLP